MSRSQINAEPKDYVEILIYSLPLQKKKIIDLQHRYNKEHISITLVPKIQTSCDLMIAYKVDHLPV